MRRKNFAIAIGLLAAFALWTFTVCFVDVQPIGPQGSSVGLAYLNQCVHNLTGTHFLLYEITDWLGLVPFAVCMGFGILGLAQWIRRKQISKVDFDILVLGGFYIATIAAYLLFENLVINYRPVLINEVLEVSYPSSTTLLTMCVMPTAAMQLNMRIKNVVFRRCVVCSVWIFTAFMVIGRTLSGVHWITDIIGGALLSAELVMMYRVITEQSRL